MKWKVAAVVVLLAVGLGTVGYVLFAPGSNGSGASAYLTAAVSRGNVTAAGRRHRRASRRPPRTTLAFGSDPVLSTTLQLEQPAASSAASSTSWLVKDVSVGVGDRVAKGDVLATADTASAKAALDLAKANLAVAKARLAVDKAGLTGAERAAAYDSIRQAQQQLKVAKQSQAQTADQNELKLAQARTHWQRPSSSSPTTRRPGRPARRSRPTRQRSTRRSSSSTRSTSRSPGLASTDSITNQQNQLKLHRRRRPWRAPSRSCDRQLRPVRLRTRACSPADQAVDQPGAAGTRHPQPPDPGRERADVGAPTSRTS